MTAKKKAFAIFYVVPATLFSRNPGVQPVVPAMLFSRNPGVVFTFQAKSKATPGSSR